MQWMVRLIKASLSLYHMQVIQPKRHWTAGGEPPSLCLAILALRSEVSPMIWRGFAANEYTECMAW